MDRDKKLILLQQQIDRWIANEREQKYILMNAMDIATLFLTIGLDFDFAMIPPNDKTSILLDELKKHGFISKDTKLEHFRILFGIPLHKKNTPFEPIKWQKINNCYAISYIRYLQKRLFGIVDIQLSIYLQISTGKELEYQNQTGTV